MTQSVIIKRVGFANVITLNRPAARNAVNPEAAAALKEAFLAGEAEADIRVHILTGADGNFCAGADLKAVAAGAEFKTTAPMGPSWLELTKPSIAAVEGHAVAGRSKRGVWGLLPPLGRPTCGRRNGSLAALNRAVPGHGYDFNGPRGWRR